ncbi:hypothetical protein SIN8267_01928 [Sinobacterium norvegicum]|uniref:Uroporphyrinogen-III C-methyltransferase n=1 Tax=Sinobacterium norvegicum TaxID=1641715 RepID=A0ABN8EHF8_9GAMM|nr:uroporphyrinogen-III C-methyltransferase [Sinobacterium norvegicum]CAH0991813.1 hypothetical protein SIN8267_01928 [Sinobacterium norvegicum]
MSDSNNDKQNKPENSVSNGEELVPTLSAEVIEQPAEKASPKQTVRRAEKKSSAGLLAFAALFIALVAVAGTAYFVVNNMTEQQLLEQKLSSMDDRLQAAFNRADVLTRQLKQQADDTTATSRESARRLDGFDDQLQSQGRRLRDLATTDPRDWKLAEVEYLSRLANQRLHMGRDTKGSLALLETGDKILYELNDAGLYTVRQAFRRDITSLKAVARFDLEGSFQRLAAVSDQINELKLYDDPRFKSEELAPVESEVVEGWWAKFINKFERAADKLFSLVQIQSRDIEIEPLPSTSDAFLLRQRLLLFADIAQTSLLLGQQQIFSQSIDRLQWHIERNYLTDDPKTQVILDELSHFDKLDIVPELPNISGSERAISAFIEAEHQMTPSQEQPRLSLPVDVVAPAPEAEKKSAAEAIDHGGNR